MLSSISSCVLDLLVFYIALAILNGVFGHDNTLFLGLNANTLSATVIARIISSMFNFTMNKKAVFKSKTPVKSTLVRYYVLCVAQMAVSAGTVALVEMFISVKFEIVTTIIKAVVDGILFLISFPIQRKWVFKK